jgi:hypothetical protein
MLLLIIVLILVFGGGGGYYGAGRYGYQGPGGPWGISIGTILLICLALWFFGNGFAGFPHR